MWKDFSSGYIKGNRASCVSIAAAALIAATLLSLVCGLYYNFWVYDIEKIVLDEGDWQARVVGKLDQTDITAIRNFANVDEAAVNTALSTDEQTVVDIIFHNARSVFRDVPLITEQLGLGKDAAQYHLLLLSRYLIHDPADDEPPMLLTFYLVILAIVSLSLILIIHNSFAVSMGARVRQLGILSSIGATPGQIRTCLMQEAAVLCGVPILAGSGIGIVLSFLSIGAVNTFASGVSGRHEAVFQYHPLVLLLTLTASAATVLISAWLPARRLSRLTPLQAIRDTGEPRLKRKKHSPVLSFLFGIEGELAGNALKAQRKAFRTSTLSLTLSFLGFTLMLCFFTLSAISTDHTYFQRYQDAWDIMMTVKDTSIADFGLTDEMKKTAGVRDLVVYQRALAESAIPEEWQSEELKSIGGLAAVAGNSAAGRAVKVPIVVMDDASFLTYCEREGIEPGLDGCAVLNRVWDSINSTFRYKRYIPFLNGAQSSINLRNINDGDAADIEILGFAREQPALREEYDDYSLVMFVPLSCYSGISQRVANAEADSYIRILARENATLETLDELENRLKQTAAPLYRVKSENRIREKMSNDDMLNGYMMIIGALCILLAVIGVANVFANTMSFLRQRRREFAQYMSVGMTREGMRKLFCIEALVVAGRPLAITLPTTVIAVAFLINASHLNPNEFLVCAPVVPVLTFILAIFVFVALAYFIGGKRLLKRALSEALKSESAC